MDDLVGTTLVILRSFYSYHVTGRPVFQHKKSIGNSRSESDAEKPPCIRSFRVPVFLVSNGSPSQGTSKNYEYNCMKSTVQFNETTAM